MSGSKRVLVVGGVAGGASCAARLRRIDEQATITIFDRGPYVSFANCGLPYYVGNVILEESKLLLATPDLFRERFNIEVRTRSDVIRIRREQREIDVCDLAAGREYSEPYDALVLAPGAAPVIPQWPGVSLPGIFVLRTIPDSRLIREWIESRPARRAVVVGGGFIGLEMAENLKSRGLDVTILEALPQLMPALDAEMAEPILRHLETNRVNVNLGDGVTRFEQAADGGLNVVAQSGAVYPADLVILAVGVKPDAGLAVAAGLEIGQRCGIRVDAAMRTSDPHIWAVGDVVEVPDVITGEDRTPLLAGPANRQGRVAADSIGGREACFRGVQGTLICGVFGLTAAMTGASEKALQRAGCTAYETVYLHPGSHAGYYPGSKKLTMKLIFSTEDGRVLGAQAVGEDGADKRIDVIAMSIQKQATVYDLAECELCYAPQFGSAKDPVNLAGMIAVNVLAGDSPLAPWRELAETGALIVDVREPHEFAAGHIDNAVNVPLSQLRRRVGELPRDREIWVNCAVGQRAYYAQRFLAQNGFRVRNLSGGYLTYWGLYP